MNKTIFDSINIKLKIKSFTASKETPSLYGYTTKDLDRICVYSHTYDDENNPFYIGQGSIRRAFDFVNRNKAWKTKVKKLNKVKVSILYIDISIEESINLETKLIEQYGRIDNNTGCLVNGNDGNSCIGCTGDKNYFYDKHLYGKDNGNFGNKYDLNTLSIPVIQLDIFGNIVKRWSSAREAQEVGNFEASSIAACCKHKRGIANNYQWIYESEYDSNKDYMYIPRKTHKRIYLSFTIYGDYVKTYYSTKELIADGFSPKNVSQVCNGNKKTHKNYVFKDFYCMSKRDKLMYIEKGLVKIYN